MSGDRKLRIACFGWVARNAGSCVTGHFLALRSLLRAGHQVDLFGERGVVDPRELRDLDGYRFHELPERLVTWWVKRSPQRSVPKVAMNAATDPLFNRVLKRTIAAAHADRPYDVLLFVGVQARCRVAGLPVVEWVQGSPQAEAEAFRRQRTMVVNSVGLLRYAMYSTYYRIDRVMDRVVSTPADLTICGSRWAASSLVAHGLPGDRVGTLPYPVDMDRFDELPTRRDGPFTLLHLGRLDPRKRPDLLVAAFRELLQEVPDARLLVVGRSGIIPGGPAIVTPYDLSDHITYIPGVPASAVPDLFEKVDVLVQTSEAENFGSAIAEAMMCGIPVVIGPTNGTADYIDPASQCFDEYTPRAVTHAILKVKHDISKDNGTVRHARSESARDHFSPDAVAGRLIEMLGEIQSLSTVPGVRPCA